MPNKEKLLPIIQQISSKIRIVIRVLNMFPRFNLIALFTVPLITAYCSLIFHEKVTSKISDPFEVAFIRAALDILAIISQNTYSYSFIGKIRRDYGHRINLANAYCATHLPDKITANIESVKESRNQKKIMDFISSIPVTWTFIINFISIVYRMRFDSEYPIRLIFVISSITLIFIMVYNFDEGDYYNEAPADQIVHISDKNYVKMQRSLGLKINSTYFDDDLLKQDRQANIHSIVFTGINTCVVLFSLKSGNIGQALSFANIIISIKHFIFNVKNSIFHKEVKEYLDLIEFLESHKRKSGDKEIDYINSIRFENATFGYFTPEMKRMSPKIINLNYEFTYGRLYYLEAQNGSGKSTFLKMFDSNLFDGNIYFNGINRDNISEIDRHIFTIHQSSEFTPKIQNNKIKLFKDANLELKKLLKIDKLFDTSFNNLSGGEKKRMLVYLALISPSTLILLDEVMSEMSAENTVETGEGGWQRYILEVLIDFAHNNKKIIILVGHGLRNLIENDGRVINLKLISDSNGTHLH